MSEFKFFDYISEGKLVRNDSLQRMTYTDVCDLILLYFLALQTMRFYPSSKKYVQNYTKEVLKWNDWHYHRMSGNDLYNLLNIVDIPSIPEFDEPSLIRGSTSLCWLATLILLTRRCPLSSSRRCMHSLLRPVHTTVSSHDRSSNVGRAFLSRSLKSRSTTQRIITNRKP